MANKKKDIGAAFSTLEKPIINNETPVKNIIDEPAPLPTGGFLPGYGIARTETKSKRVQLIFPPSLWRVMKDRANAAGLSFNEYMLQLCENELRREGATK